MTGLAGMGGAAVSSLTLALLLGACGGDGSEAGLSETFTASGCLNRHKHGDAGTTNADAPDLTCEGDRGRGLEWQARYIGDRKSVDPDAQMPGCAHLGDAKLRELAELMEASDC